MVHVNSNLLANEDESLRIKWIGVLLVFLTPALGGFLYGYDLGATSFALKLLTSHEDEDDVVWWNNFASHQIHQGLFVGAVSAGALLGSNLVLFVLSSPSSTWHVGRRMELRLAAVLYILGTILNVVAGSIFRRCVAHGWMVLVLGRLVFGIGVGFVMHGAPTYMAEMTPAKVRGAVVSAKESVIVLGIVVGYAVGDVISESGGMWTDLYMLSLLGVFPMLLLTYKIPRSKRWLLMQGLRIEAGEALRFVYHEEDPERLEKELDKLEESLCPTQVPNTSSPYGAIPIYTGDDSSDEGSVSASFGDSLESLPGSSGFRSLFDPDIRPALAVAMGLVLFQQLSGQPSVISYAPVLFAAAGWSGHVGVVTVVLMLFASMGTVVLVDRVGRKNMLKLCCFVLGTSLCILSTTWGWSGDNERDFSGFEKSMILVAMLCFIGGYQLGFGPITWVLISEVFPGPVRGPATALGVELNYGLNFAVQLCFPILLDSLGWGATFGIFGFFMVLAFSFVNHCVPETAGRTLEEIQEDLKPKRSQHNLERLLEHPV